MTTPATPATMKTTPIAKLNLGLNIVGRRPDGYHDLQTVFYPVHGLHDDLEITAAGGTTSDIDLTTEGHIYVGETADNLVTRAYRLLAADYPLPPVRAHLVKRIPTQAGLGGGSSDGAATLVMLNAMFGLRLADDDLRRYALRLGADCPFFVHPEPAYAEGVGERLTPIALDLDRYHLAILKPPFAVSTKTAFHGIMAAVAQRTATASPRRIVAQPVKTWRATLVNDFESTVFAAHPEMGGIKRRLYDLGAVYAAMSGSGSALFALFADRVPPTLATAFPMCDIFSL